jgi:hypothetical protein
MEKIFIKIQNSFSKYVKGLLTPYLFSFEILHPGGKLENHSFRKNSSFLPNPADPNARSTLPPTYPQCEIGLEPNDY